MGVTRKGKAKKRRNYRRRILAGRRRNGERATSWRENERFTHWETGPHPVLVKMFLPLAPIGRVQHSPPLNEM